MSTGSDRGREIEGRREKRAEKGEKGEKGKVSEEAGLALSPRAGAKARRGLAAFAGLVGEQ